MAGGPFPFSSHFASSSRAFPWFHVGAGANSKYDEGLAWELTLGADTVWELRFPMPPALPTGTPKVRGLALANATSGAAKINVKWVSVAATEDPSSATPIAEGVTTLTWAAGENDDYKEFLVTLDADTVVANEIIVMRLTGETSGWTLAQVLTLTNLGVIFQ